MFNSVQLYSTVFNCAQLRFFLTTLKIVNALGLLPVSSNASYWLHMHKEKQLLWYKAMNKELRQKSNRCQILTSLVVCFFTLSLHILCFCTLIVLPTRRHLLLKMCTMLFCPLKKRHSLEPFVCSGLFWGQSSLLQTFDVVVAHIALVHCIGFDEFLCTYNNVER